MNVPMRATVYGTDGQYGHITGIVLNPKTLQATHIVIRELGKKGVERLVPIEVMAETKPDTIYLKCDVAYARRFDSFLAKELVVQSVSSMPKTQFGWYWAQEEHMRGQQKKFITVQYEQTPPGEVALRQGAHAEAKDGAVGVVNELLINPENGHITHLVIREGPIWSQKDIAVESSFIDYIQQKTIYLELSKQQVRDLPAVPVRQRQRQPTA